jgi:hypothetical protein
MRRNSTDYGDMIERSRFDPQGIGVTSSGETDPLLLHAEPHALMHGAYGVAICRICAESAGCRAWRMTIYF